MNNFQSLTAEAVREKESVGKSEEMARMKRELSVEIVRHNYQLKQARCIFKNLINEQ